MKKNLFTTFAITAFTFSSFLTLNSCQKPAERPAVIDEKIADNTFEIQKMQVDNQTTESAKAQQAAIDKCLSLTTDENQKKLLSEASQQGRISVKIEEGKLNIIIKKSNIDSSAATDTEKLSTQSKQVEITLSYKITTGILENELTDYNEKKSLLNITPKQLSESTHFSIDQQIVDPVSTI